MNRRPVLAAAGVVLAGAGLLVVVAHDGTPLWQVARGLTVVGVVIGLLAAGRLSAPARSGCRFAAGVVALAVGVGIAVPHLAKDGISVVALAGLLCLIGGLALLVIGGAELVGGVRGWWRRVPLAAALVVVVLLGLVTLGQATAVTNVPRTEVGATTPADRGVAFEDVSFSTVDGVRLSGWYLPSSNGAALALLHGAGSTRANVLDHAVVLARHGYGVLLFDARGHGRSGGRAMDFGWYGDEDTDAAVAFLVARPEVDDDRVGAVGMSLGGEVALGAAAADDRIAAVVAEGATNRTAADKAWLSEELGVAGRLQEQLDRVTYGLVDLFTAAGPPIALRDAVAVAAPRPVFLIAAGEVDDEARAAAYIAGGSPDTVERWVVPGSGHTGGLATRPQEWERRVVGFLDVSLGG